ncbi:MAG: hypothetical protein LBG14_03380 [Treponema sp.]|nr:hypothetical protein [Treponema sp.]
MARLRMEADTARVKIRAAAVQANSRRRSGRRPRSRAARGDFPAERSRSPSRAMDVMFSRFCVGK